MNYVFSEMGEVGGTGHPMGDSFEWAEYVEVKPPRPTVCDACPGCGDTCGVPSCSGCKSKRDIQNSLGVNSSGRFTMCEVRRHCTRDDCWLVVHGKVYNATTFITKHPAGARPILSRAGQDCTQDYDFHSTVSHREFWRPLMIGKVVRCSIRDRSNGSNTFCTIQ